MNLLAGGVDVGDGLLKGRAGVGHAEDPAAGGFYTLFLPLRSGFGFARSGVEDGGPGRCSVLETGDGIARANRSRIAVRSEDDTDGRFLAESQQARVLPSASRGVDESAEVAVQAMQQGLRFGVAEPHVELEHLGPGSGQHQTGIEKADERRPFGAHAVQARVA